MANLLYEDLTYKIIGAAREVHFVLRPGYLESVYEDALCYELDKLKVSFERQVDLDINYKDTIFSKRFRADLLVEDKVLVENSSLKGNIEIKSANSVKINNNANIKGNIVIKDGGAVEVTNNQVKGNITIKPQADSCEGNIVDGKVEGCP
ncbi:GxxExxY protein [candidate division KSB1 bacterium]|nr:GxxExxY protein [candidate division KSB1 bacterium]